MVVVSTGICRRPVNLAFYIRRTGEYLLLPVHLSQINRAGLPTQSITISPGQWRDADIRHDHFRAVHVLHKGKAWCDRPGVNSLDFERGTLTNL